MNLGDWLSIAAVVCIVIRLVMVHFILTLGTSNVSEEFRRLHQFTPQEIAERETGSKLAIANRVFYNSYLWLQKLVLLDVYRRLYQNLRFEKIVVTSILVIFFGTYAACQISTFVECTPIELYWQLVPDPGSCVKAQLQLIVVGVTNIVTDFILLILPLPIVFQMLSATWQRKVQLVALFMLGLFVIIITAVRLPINHDQADSQLSRTTWASVELVVAAFVVNAPTLYGLWNKRRQESKLTASSHVTGPGMYGLGTSRTHRKLRDEESSGGDSYEMDIPRGSSGSQDPKNGITLTREVIVHTEEVPRAEQGNIRGIQPNPQAAWDTRK
ncbi:hypothetical protein MCOR27_002954 [Pyricularia oryzae]|uniref:Rhodopsin domain-containing protein n=5 Tax=Pyricularia TaxID=48558 RepID=A0ABQ8NCU5_PYRGI|nr:uncharacterized protein MGG_09467 [Pyricularia oryzae 70-15]ELQ39247.1 hypothetical protein OOU_Y34scaffold00511g37 [Pyricularia oryzae Y34]KAH8847687.1 hypothetical protein MCOR01_001095 [Pyricularia oryzae]KAI6295001.1 hypothetical protein MCOR33_008004 [Pyricularia grisea]EHA52478.1 hypothetical protein MGG_09467 [Pyricularia oryzae 70-15]KAH9430382.1 hypothetical protein MCOR02_010088 [Pyricularia oryzae]